MFNIIVDRPPVTVEIDGVQWTINSDFRTGILFEQLINDRDVGDQERLALALQLYYPTIPDNIQEAVNQLVWFYRCGENPPSPTTSETARRTSRQNRRVVDYDVDSGLIFAAFMTDFRIDLTKARLHWWIYHSLFECLSEDNRVVKIMLYRGVDLKSIDKGQRNFYARMQRKYQLKPALSTEEMREIAGRMFAPALPGK